VTPYRSPGVYLREAAERRFARVETVPMSVAAFLGVAERGPLHIPQHLTSFTQFRELYGGFVPYGYLAHTILGFFANGGHECYVVRVAHAVDDGATARNNTRLSGRDGVGMLIPDDFIGFSEGPGMRRGLAVLDEIDDIGLIAIPDLMMVPALSHDFREAEFRAVQDALVAHCERRKDRFAILDPPPAYSPEQVREWRRHFDSKYAALYYPWVKVTVSDMPGGGVRTVPPSGHIAGVYARCDREQGIHKAPANEVLEEVVGLETFVSRTTEGLLNHEHINCLRAFPGRGIRIWGARTLSSDASWQHVNVRRLVTMIERAVDEGTQWVVFEDNEPMLWKQVTRSVAGFLRELARRGYLVGESDQEAFYVKCDEETNPPEVVEAGQLVCEIGVAPVRPAEFIVFRIGQRTGEPIIE
jgi:phage tail sheath protein FI